jgi:hypothetical protein
MKRPGLLLIVAALLIAACGGAANGAAGSPDDPVSAPAMPDSGGGGSKSELREPEEGLVDVYERIFDRHKAEGKKVTLYYWSGVDECYGLDHIEIKERSSKVVLTIFEGRDPEAEVCTEQAVKVRSIATLQRPLGDRRVVDGAE